MQVYLKGLRESQPMSFFLGCIFGAAFFIVTWGITPLDPFNLKWILPDYGADLSFAEIGALRFLKESWSFPFGVIKGLLYPNDTSIVFTDGVPLFALIAKLFSPLTNRDYQYFGIWGFTCSVLQGGLGSLIMWRFYKDSPTSAIASIFLILSPFFLLKMFGHISMSGQWVILLSILLIWCCDSAWVVKYEIALWSLNAVISVTILAYFTPMVFALMALYYWRRVQNSGVRIVFSFLMTLIISIVVCAIAFWLIGGFLPGTASAPGGYSANPYNLNGLINPWTTSKTIRPFAPGIGNMGESYAWLGLGVIIATLYLSIDAIMKFQRSMVIGWARRSLPFIVIGTLLMAYAATNKMMFGDDKILEVTLPDSVLSAFSTFRTSGRFIWPVWYLIVTSIIGGLAYKTPSIWRRNAVLILLISVQVWDGFEMLNHINRRTASNAPPPLASPFWTNMQGVKHLNYLPLFSAGTLTQEIWGYINYQAVKQNITVSQFWEGRYPFKGIYSTMEEKLTDLGNGKIQDGDLFIINYPSALSQIDFSGSIGAYKVDNQFVVSKKGLMSAQSGATNLIIHKDSLSNYLARLQSLDMDSLIIITVRSNELPVVIDEASRVAFGKLNLEKSFDGRRDFSYLGIIGGNSRVLYESIGAEKIVYTLKKGENLDGSPSPSDFNVSIAPNFGIFPTVTVDGVSFSENFIGINICVYDRKMGKVTEVGTFDLYAVKDGIYIDF